MNKVVNMIENKQQAVFAYTFIRIKDNSDSPPV